MNIFARHEKWNIDVFKMSECSIVLVFVRIVVNKHCYFLLIHLLSGKAQAQCKSSQPLYVLQIKGH